MSIETYVASTALRRNSRSPPKLAKPHCTLLPKLLAVFCMLQNVEAAESKELAAVRAEVGALQENYSTEFKFIDEKIYRPLGSWWFFSSFRDLRTILVAFEKRNADHLGSVRKELWALEMQSSAAECNSMTVCSYTYTVADDGSCTTVDISTPAAEPVVLAAVRAKLEALKENDYAHFNFIVKYIEMFPMIVTYLHFTSLRTVLEASKKRNAEYFNSIFEKLEALEKRGFECNRVTGFCPGFKVPDDRTCVDLPPYTFKDKADLETAVKEFDADPTAATATYGLIAEWDISAITDMSYLFYDLQNFNADISSWDTSKVTTMEGMFLNTPSLSNANKLLIRCAWATQLCAWATRPCAWAGNSAFGDAGTRSCAWGSCSSWGSGTCTTTTKASLKTAVQAYNTSPTAATDKYGPIALWDVSGITDMRFLFSSLKNFNADISNWDTSSVTDMYHMFLWATAFNQPLSFDTSKVTDMSFMFSDALAFNQPLSFDTSKVTNMGGMFADALAFNQPLSFDTSKVTNMQNMFWANSLSDANKLLIRCAWAGTSAFTSAGYGSSWGPGTCASPSSSN